ncbi:MAG: cytosolic protein [Leptospiraceae bacterium]|nr:cytosolic protein [Leptospiraceae bacterium]
MNTISIDEVKKYVEDHIGSFHSKRLKSLEKLKLKTILKRKNPYLYKAKNIHTFYDLVKSILDAHLSSQEEGLFGEFLESLAIHISSTVNNGYKSSTEGIDLEFFKEGIKYIVSIKSGPNWGNSSQIKKMIDQFRKAKKTLGTNTQKINIVAVNGCCYGRDNQPDKGEYLKLCGQSFWEFISGNPNLYKEIIEPLGFMAQKNNEDFLKAYSQMLNQLSEELSAEFSFEGNIDWNKILEHNSSMY